MTTQQAPDYEALKDLYMRVRQLREAVGANKIGHYRPIGHQADFHASDTAEVRLVLGGNRSGKTTSGCVEAISHALGYRPWLPEDHPNRVVRLCNGDPVPIPNVGRIVVENFEINVVQTLHPKMMEWCPKGAITNIQKNPRSVPVRYDFSNGSVIHVLSYEQDDEAFEGPSGHWAWCDEPPPQRKFNGLRRGLVDYDGHIWLTMTPLSEPWINEVLFSQANEPGSHVRAFTYNIWDNCIENGGYLSGRAITNFLKDQPADERAAREKGQFLHLAGLVFPEWRPEPPFWVDPFTLPASWPRVRVIDPHPRKPVAVMWAALSPDHVWHIYRTLFDEDMRTIRAVSIAMHEAEGWKRGSDRYDPRVDRMMPTWQEMPGTEQIALTLIDTSANEAERTSGSTVAEEFAAYGVFCTTAYKRNYDAGIKAIHEALEYDSDWATPGIVVFNTCAPVKQNFLNFVWDRWGNSRQAALKGDKQAPVKYNDDFIDAIRYLFQARLTYSMLRSIPRRRERDLDAEDDDRSGRMRRGPDRWITSRRSSGCPT